MATVPDAPPPIEEKTPVSIGNATMLPDGTLRLMLRGVGPNGAIAETLAIMKPGDERYEKMLKSLGAMVPGDSRLIPPG